MLHFRFSTVLTELFQTNLKRPLTGSRHKTRLPIHYCFATASFDAKAISKLKVIHADVHRPLLCTTPWTTRSYCTKTDGAVAVAEPEKKDGINHEPTSDKYVSIICLVN